MQDLRQNLPDTKSTLKPCKTGEECALQNAVRKKIPERKCIGCSEKKAKSELIRIVRLPDSGGIEIDRTGKKSGRGAYICRSKACLKKARRRLEASLMCTIPDEIFEKLELEIEREHT